MGDADRKFEVIEAYFAARGLRGDASCFTPELIDRLHEQISETSDTGYQSFERILKDILGQDKQHVLLMSVRQALIITLGALEDYLGLERSIVPRHKR